MIRYRGSERWSHGQRAVGLAEPRPRDRPGFEVPSLVCLLGLLVAMAAGTAVAAGAQEPVDAEDRRPGVAVFELADGGSYGPEAEDFGMLTVGLQELLLTELDQHNDLRIVERRALNEVLEEQDLVEEERVDPATAAEVGELVGARYAVTGVFVDLYESFRMDARIVDVETGEILSTERVEDHREELYDLVVDLAARVMEGVELSPLSQEEQRERKDRFIPAEAVARYSRAISLEERGDTEAAAEAYRELVDSYPDMVEAEVALEEMGSR